MAIDQSLHITAHISAMIVGLHTVVNRGGVRTSVLSSLRMRCMHILLAFYLYTSIKSDKLALLSGCDSAPFSSLRKVT